MSTALRVEGLRVAYRVRGREERILRGVDLAIPGGGAYGLVGESGSGKSTLALAVLGALPRTGRITGGRVLIAGADVGVLTAAELLSLRARRLATVFQDPSKALNPSLSVGRQILEAYQVLGVERRLARREALSMLARVGISEPERVLASYPHQLSGGMQQRALIAMALAKRPELLILDEPTTGLDATVEAEVLDVIAGFRREFGTAILLISHNLGIVGRMCERIGVLYAGGIVEEGPAEALLADPRHPYTVGLLRALPTAGRSKREGPLETIPGFPPAPWQTITGCAFAPRCPLARARCENEPPPRVTFADRFSACHYIGRARLLAERRARITAVALAFREKSAAPPPLLEARHISKTFRVRGNVVQALDDVSLELAPGETLGLVGESGSGKTTLAKILVGLVAPDSGGTLRLDGGALATDAKHRTPAARKALTIVFQNPDSALNRAHTIARLIGRVLTRLGGFKGAPREQRLHELLAGVRLEPRYLGARPRQLSGGLKQRVAIACAFAGDPRAVVCDEPTSSLDVSVQAAILNLLVDLQRERRTSYLFISHDLRVVRYLADRITVLYRGRVMESGPAEEVFRAPHHPYTEALLAAALGKPARTPSPPLGATREAASPPRGCAFQSRCPHKLGSICETIEPPLRAIGRHVIRCHIPLPELARLESPA